jgi:hypothetical protein
MDPYAPPAEVAVASRLGPARGPARAAAWLAVSLLLTYVAPNVVAALGVFFGFGLANAFDSPIDSVTYVQKIVTSGTSVLVWSVVTIALFAFTSQGWGTRASRRFSRAAPTSGTRRGGGEAARSVARHGKGLAKKAVLISAVAPIMVKSDKNPDGVPMSVFDDIRSGTANNRPQYFQDFTTPFYGYNRPGAKVSQGVRDNWWRQGMMGGVKAHYDCIKAFSETDFTEDLKSIDVPVLVMHGEDDQIVPFPITRPRSAKLAEHGTLKSYPGFPHGMPTTNADVISADLLAFFKS